MWPRTPHSLFVSRCGIQRIGRVSRWSIWASQTRQWKMWICQPHMVLFVGLWVCGFVMDFA